MNRLKLPSDLQADLYTVNDYLTGGFATIEILDDYLISSPSWTEMSEVVCIQRLISLANNAVEVRVVWGNLVATTALRSPTIFPLLSVVLCLDNSKHFSVEDRELEVGQTRKKIYEYQFQADYFSDVQILLCADNRGHGRPKSLYNSEHGGLISREDFESVIDTLLSTHTGYGISNSKAVFFIQSIATIVAELFENTDVHGRLGLDGKPIRKNGLRGIIFKRVKILQNGEWRKVNEISLDMEPSERRDTKNIDALEISIFDTGIGFFSSYTRREMSSEVSVVEEWDVVHKCLERHFDENELSFRPAHRAMGLYEVLRALKMVNGILEVRSGRTFGYRTFVPGELKFQLEASTSSRRPNMPKPVLLDRARKFVRVPTEHEYIIGSSVRVVIPLI